MRTLCCDIGSGSVRVAIFEYLERPSGPVLGTKPLALAVQSIIIHNPRTDFYEQRTGEIWSAFKKCVTQCLNDSGLNSTGSSFPIDSIAFSATCSLVILDPVGGDQNDVIMWMDHRAKAEADEITASGHRVLNQFGGVCSPELSLAKLLWLFRNQKDRFNRAQAFMELSDWITYRCSEFFFQKKPELFARSLCCVVCKWGYDAVEGKWRKDLFEQLGMQWSSEFESRIGGTIVNPGLPVGHLSSSAAAELGFKSIPEAGTVTLASSLIDAHSGVISMLVYGSRLTNDQSGVQVDPFENVFCLISGTSSCHMVLNQACCPTPGVWGPYADAIIPGYYLREAGQSATGSLLERVVKSHYQDEKLAASEVSKKLRELNHELVEQFDLAYKTKLVVSPTFHGNRSPVANPHLKGAIYGLNMESPTLRDMYVATVEALAYETRYIIEELDRHSEPGSSVRKIIATGGLTKNELYLQLHSDILGLELVTFSAGEADLMLVGASVIAYTANQIPSNESTDTQNAALVKLLQSLKTEPEDGFAEYVRVYKPRQVNADYHKRKYECYRKLLNCVVEMENVLSGESI